MGAISMTSYSLVPTKAFGYPNQGPWDTTLTDIALTAQEIVGIERQEGANKYVYVQFGTAAMTNAGQPVKLLSGLSDVNSILAPLCCTALGATAAGYFSAYGVTICEIQSSATYGWSTSQVRYGWVCVKGIGTLPLNSNTAGLAFRVPVAPSSSSACFAEATVSSSVGYACDPTTLGTATSTARGGQLCRFDFTRTYIV